MDHFVQRFLRLLPSDAEITLSSEADYCALACLLIAKERGHACSIDEIRSLETCAAATRRRFWGDRLPWALSIEFTKSAQADGSAISELTRNLNHKDSSIRYWMMRLAWLIRERLDVDEAVPRLLDNVASTLGFWTQATGLCAALHKDEGYFWVSAEAHESDAFLDQYRERLTLIRARGLPSLQQPFVQMELEILRMITAWTLRPGSGGSS